jgi:hypothetical protein
MRYRSHRSASLLDRLRRLVVDRFQSVAFWVSVCLPFVYVPIVLTPTIESGLIVPLAAIHVCTLLIGHSYGSRGSEDRSTAKRSGGSA